MAALPQNDNKQVNFSFGQPTTTTSILGNTLQNITTNPATSTSTAPGGLLTGNVSSIAPLNTTTQSLAQPNPAATVPKTGLGGFDINTSQTKKTDGSAELTKSKDAQVPNEILVTVEHLKNYIKQQKADSSDIARAQSRKLTIQNEIQAITLNIQEISNTLDNYKSAAKLLRSDTSRLVRHVELAQRTYEIPVGLQFENTAPLQFFIEMTQKNEQELLTLKNLITTVENHMMTLSNPQPMSVEALKSGFHQLHESFVALAGRFYKIHQKVLEQKEQYLNLRKYFVNDGSKLLDTFTEKKKTDYSAVAAGPNPF